jgi:hypothetical protein
MKSQFKALSDEDLVEAFSPIAQRLGEIVVNWLPGGAKETRRLFALEDEIRGRGREARLKLAPPLHSDYRFVRYYAAQELIGLLPEKCRSIIEENTRECDAIAGDARGFLRAIDEGTYKPE